MTSSGRDMELTNQDIIDLVAFRRELHRFPEISNEEAETARRVIEFLSPTEPDRILTGLGGHGVAAVYDSGVPGPTVLFRSELDALPIEERSDAPHRSAVPGKSHMCDLPGTAERCGASERSSMGSASSSERNSTVGPGTPLS